MTYIQTEAGKSLLIQIPNTYMVESELDFCKFQKLLNILTGSTCSEVQSGLWKCSQKCIPQPLLRSMYEQSCEWVVSVPPISRIGLV